MKPAEIMIIDLNALGYTSLYQPELSRLSIEMDDGEKMLTGAIVGTINTLSQRLYANPSATPMSLWDGKADWRYQIHPQYKSDRRADINSSDPKEAAKAKLQAEYKKQVPYIQMLLLSLGIPQIRGHQIEADDFAGLICKNASGAIEIEMVTKDTDWYQNVSPTVRWLRPNPRKLITWESINTPEGGLDVDKVFFKTPLDCLRAKALAGDASDSIPGVYGIGMGYAKKYLDQFGSYEQMWEAYDSGEYKPSGKKAQDVVTTEARQTYYRNLSLMDFTKAQFNCMDEVSILRQAPDEEAFNDLCDLLELKKLKDVFARFKSNYDESMPAWNRHLNLVEVAEVSCEI